MDAETVAFLGNGNTDGGKHYPQVVEPTGEEFVNAVPEPTAGVLLLIAVLVIGSVYTAKRGLSGKTKLTKSNK